MTSQPNHPDGGDHPDHPDHPDHDHDHDELFTLGEVADRLRVPPATMRYWRHRGTGPRSFRVGRHVRYQRTDVDAWLRDQRRAGGPGGA